MMKFKTLLYSIIFILSACNTSNKDNLQELIGEAQGTTYTIKYTGAENNTLKFEIDSILDSFDKSLSTYESNSLISHLNQNNKVETDEWLKFMFLESKTLNLLTSGSFDPTIGPLIKEWGFDFSEGQWLDSSTVDSLKNFCGFSLYQLFGDSLYKNPSAYLNFNAIAQGYAVDLLAKHIQEKGILNYYVELGGELKVMGLNAKDSLWRIGIDKPQGENLERKLSAIIPLDNKAMATSGNYRKFYEKNGKRYSHTINPITGFPVKHTLLSATVIADDCYKADALATAFMVMGLEQAKLFLEQNKEFEVVLIYEEGGELKTFVSSELDSSVKLI